MDENLQDIKKLDNTNKYGTGTVFFLSFDIVNSTQFKIVEPEKWLSKIRTFYSNLDKRVGDITSSAYIWKQQGDEVLIYFTIKEVNELYDVIRSIYSLSQSLIKDMQKDEGKSLLSVKTTLWAALVTASVSEAQDINFAISCGVQPAYDYIGPDIDFGFRIAMQSAGGVICIDPKIIAMLSKHDKENCTLKYKFKIIDFKQLKGVWRDRFVPIIWYHPDIENPDKIFPYDEVKKNKLVENLLKRKEQDVSNIDKIFEDLGKSEIIDKLIEGIGKFPMGLDTITSERIAEVHMVAVLLNEEKNKFFCAKRSTTKNILPNNWEHGCVQLRMGIESPEQLIKKQYKNDFEIEVIEFKKDERLEGDELYILCTYSFKNKYNRTIPGFVVTGIAKETISNKWDKNKHSQIKWMTLDDIEKLPKNECVPNFKQHIKIAKDIWDSTFIGKTVTSEIDKKLDIVEEAR